MKKGVLLLLTILFSVTMLNAQSIGNMSKRSEQVLPDSPGKAVHFIDPTLTPDMLKQLNEAKRLNKSKPNHTTADNVGDIKNFWVSNMMLSGTTNFESREFKLMRKGSVSQLWFATEDLSKGRLTEAVADTMFAYLENRTNSYSYNSDKGVIAIGNEIFGNPPNFDGDGLSDVLVCDIRDGWTPGNSYTAGFFYGIDQYTQSDLNAQGYSSYKSNERDIIYIDSYPGIFYNDIVTPTAPLSTLSHEYQHLIHYNYDGNEISFINEGQSCFASLLVGYEPHGGVYDYLANTNVSIFTWRSGNDVLKDYGRAASFTSYLWDQYGFENAGKLTQNTLQANAGVDQVLNQLNAGYNFAKLLENWHIANAANDVSANSLYGYTHPLTKNWKTVRSFLSNPNQTGTANVSNGGAENIAFRGVKDVSVKVTFSSGVVKIITKKDANTNVENVTNGVEWHSSAGVTFDEILVLMINAKASIPGTTDSGTIPFTYNVSGTSSTASIQDYGDSKYYWQIPYYNASQAGRMGFSHKYAPVTGGVLTKMRLYVYQSQDGSIKINGSGSIKLAVYSDKNGFPDQLIHSKSVDFSSLIVGWNEFDVSDWSYQFRANIPFHVAYEFSTPVVNPDLNSVPLLLDDGKGKQGVTKIWSGTEYLNNMFLENNLEENIINEITYAIVTGVENHVPQAYTEGFSLSQNYPNPFNPTTKISYKLNQSSNVKLTVFDLLGREVMTLVNQHLPQGEHQVTVDGSKLNSGMYFYQLKVGNQFETKRMMLIK